MAFIAPQALASYFTNKARLADPMRSNRPHSRSARTSCSAERSSPMKESRIGRELIGKNRTWTQEQFDEWTAMRTGPDTGAPVYWYAIGDVFSAPHGGREMIIEGVDVSSSHRLSATKLRQLSRKIFVFRDLGTNEIMKEVDGKDLTTLRYDYQMVTYSLEDGSLIAETTYGKGDNVRTLRGDRFYWRDVKGGFVVCSPLFTERGWMESYDFHRFHGENRVSWHGIGPSSLVDSGHVMMEMSGIRLESFDDVPEGLREYISREAPLWRMPPADLDEIKRLQQQ